MPINTRELLARLIRCEAEGEGENGMKAVATVIMNRVHVAYGQYMGKYSGNLREVILDPGEFTCVLTRVNGKYNPQNIYNITPEKIHYDIADWALSGNKHYGAAECLWYMNPYTKNCPKYFPLNKSGIIFNKLGKHCFYYPTKLYAKT